MAAECFAVSASPEEDEDADSDFVPLPSLHQESLLPLPAASDDKTEARGEDGKRPPLANDDSSRTATPMMADAPPILEGLRSMMAAQRACLREVESKFDWLEKRGSMLEAEMIRAATTSACRCCGRLSEAAARATAAEDSAAQPKASAVPAGAARGDSFEPHSIFADAPPVEKAPNSNGRSGSKAEAIIEMMLESDMEVQARTSADREEAPRVWWKQMVRSPKFDLALGGVIIANTIIMSLQIEYNGRILEREVRGECVADGCDDSRILGIEDFFFWIEQCFTLAFAVELLLRIATDGFAYLKQPANMGDALIVVVSGIDSWVLTSIGSEDMQNVAVLRLVRLVRLSKVLRVVRVMKAFKSLRVLVSAVVNSVGALAWSMTLLFVFELIGAIFLAQLLQPVIADPKQDPELRKFLCARFGTWMHAMLSLFDVTMAPGGFMQYRPLYEEVHQLFGLFLMAYVCVVTFAVVRVITAMFLKATLSASDKDEAREVREKAHQRELYAGRLVNAVKMQDPDGRIGQSDFCLLMDIPEVKEWLEDVLLYKEGAMRLFWAMDNGSGQIVFADFMSALLRIKAHPKGVDSVIMLSESSSILRRVKRTEQVFCSPYVDRSLGRRDPHRVQDRASFQLDPQSETYSQVVHC